MESDQAPPWKIVPGAVSWMEFEGAFVITPVLYSKNDYSSFLTKINKMKKSDMVVSVIEHKNSYTAMFFEDPKKEMLADIGFMLCHMGLQGSYRQFKENHNNDTPVILGLGKYTPRSIAIRSKQLKFGITPFPIEKFRVIKESELHLDKLISPYGFALPQEHKYRNEMYGLYTLFRCGGLEL